jgi:hypothetical protein
LLLSPHGKLQNINPVKVDKRQLLTWKRVSTPTGFRIGRGRSLPMMIDKKGVDDVIDIYHLRLL